MSSAMSPVRDPQVILLDRSMNFERTPDLRRTLLKAVAAKRDILIDFSNVTYIDSSGIACLIEALHVALGRGTRLALVSVGVRVMRVLKLARLDMVFLIHNDFVAAIEHG